MNLAVGVISHRGVRALLYPVCVNSEHLTEWYESALLSFPSTQEIQ